MTTRYAALLRGVNVGGHRKVPMADLRALLADLGLTDAATHLQSGNAVFTGPDAAADGLTADLERALAERFGFGVDCIVRDAGYLRAVVEDCPFPAAELEPKQVHVTYLSADAGPERFAGITAEEFAPEEYRTGDRLIYLYAPEGLGRSRLADALARPAVTRGLVATTRNWNTVTRLAELTAGPG
jgi:uncharacterized protein (DUF1697 family)